jgi:hypothetical protein
MPSLLDLHPGVRLTRGLSPTLRKGRSLHFPRVLLLASFLPGLICTSCGTGGSDPPVTPPATITITPNPAQTLPGGQVPFSAKVESAQSSTVNWQVNGMSPGNPEVGMIDSTGLYTAPSFVPGSGQITVTAVLQANPGVTASATVAIQRSLTISPAHSSFSSAQPVLLKVAGIDNSAVNWAVDTIAGGNSTVGTVLNGHYDPPPGTGSHLITATLIVDPEVTGEATVAITGFPGIFTWRNDNMRSGVNNQELALTPATVNSSTFGKLFSCPIDGYAYAQPLYLSNFPIAGKGTHNVIIVATENDSVFAFDADTKPCNQLWVQNRLIPAGSQVIDTPNQQITSAAIVPHIGITGTPVISMATSAVYLVAAMQTISGPTNSDPNYIPPTYSQLLYALDLGTGQPEIHPAGVPIATPTGQAPPFKPILENQRAALLLNSGTVYIGFGSYDGQGDYHGWLFGYDSFSLLQAGVFNDTPDFFLVGIWQRGGHQGGVWQSGGGPSVDPNDPNHDVFVLTGAGQPNQGVDYSDSFLRLGTNNGLTVTDYFTPCDQELGNTVNADSSPQSASSAPLLLPDTAGSASQPHLLVGGTKEGLLYVVNRDNMGGFLDCPDLQPRVQVVAVGDGPILSTPLFWNGAVFVAAANGKLKSFPMSEGVLASSASAFQSPETLGPQGATPAISWNGANINTAIIWLIDTSGAQTWPAASGPAILRAFDPNNLSNEIYDSTTAAASRDNAGPAVKFTVPTVANGKVYVGTQTELDVYGFLQ